MTPRAAAATAARDAQRHDQRDVIRGDQRDVERQWHRAGTLYVTPEVFEAALGAHAAQEAVVEISEGRQEPSYAFDRFVLLQIAHGRRSIALQSFIAELAKSARRPETQ